MPLTALTNRVIGDPERKRVLIVDDEETIRLALGRFLRSRGYDVDTAASAAEALEQIGPGHYAVMICDIRMPGMTGLELLPLVRERDPDMAIMMLTAVDDTSTAAESLALGAMEYLMKPIELGELQLAVERVLHRRHLVVEQRNVERIIRDEVRRQTTLIRDDRHESMDLATEALASVVDRFEAKDSCFHGMSARVAALATAIAEVLDLGEEQRDAVRRAGRLHDIGRIALQEAIVTKAGPLSATEFEHVKLHVGAGLEILAPLAHDADFIAAVADHHEHWNGTGYPRGLAGSDIAIGGRILCAADAFVALTSRRPYRAAMTEGDALAYLATQSGSFLDPTVYDALRHAIARRQLLGLTAE